MTLSTVFLVVAVLLGCSRALSFTAKLWNKLPAQLVVVLPALVALASCFFGASVLHALLAGLALLAPGMKDHSVKLG